jgi:hypothetical protein
VANYIVEVQHCGKWTELERTSNGAHAVRLWDYFFVVKPIPKGVRPEQCNITGSYSGMPGRIRIEK